MTRIAVSVVLVMLLSGWTPPSDNILRFVESKEAAEKVADVDSAGRKGHVYRSHRSPKGQPHRGSQSLQGRRNKISGVSARRGSLVSITEIYLALDPSEAQTAVAVLGRKFPDSRWSAEAHDA